jgi:hypothetical protein
MLSQHLALGKTKKTIHSGFTRQNMLGEALLHKPEIIPNVIRFYGDKYTLSCLTQGTGRMFNVTKDSRDYRLLSSNKIVWFGIRNLSQMFRVVSSPIPPPNGLIGGTTPFTFTFEMQEAFFYPGDVLRFPSGAHAYVLNFGQPTGTNQFTYNLQCLTPLSFLAPEDLLPDISVVRGYNLFGEKSIQGFSNQFTPVKYFNHLTTCRKGFGLSGDALTDIVWMAPSMVPGKGSRSKDDMLREAFWWYEQEDQVMHQHFKDLEYMYWFGETTVNDAGETFLKDVLAGNENIIAGSGVFEQLKYSTRRVYEVGKTNYNFWTDLLEEMIRNSKDVSDQKFVLIGGLGFISEFDRAFQREIKSNYLVDTNVFVDAKGNEITFKGQVRRFQGLLNAEFSTIYCPMFDDPDLFGNNPHVRTGYPLMSYRGVVLDFGNYGGRPNVEFLAKGVESEGHNRSFVRKEISGMISIEGKKSTQTANSIDSTKIEYLSQTAVNILNRTTCAVIEAVNA